jgi:hypothetical protein
MKKSRWANSVDGLKQLRRESETPRMATSLTSRGKREVATVEVAGFATVEVAIVGVRTRAAMGREYLTR